MEAVKLCMSLFRLSERRACRIMGVSRSGYRYKRIMPARDRALRAALKRLAGKHPSYGCPMLHALLKAEGLVVNMKRTHRLYKEEGLQRRVKKGRKVRRARQPMALPARVNERWSMDFVHDRVADGRRFRVFNVIDDYSRECLAQVAAVSITGRRVARCLDELLASRGRPAAIVCDNGAEFTCKAMHFWSRDNQVALNFIQPGKPTQNAFVESFNGKFRESCLNLHWFRSLDEARRLIGEWRQDYNAVRPHSSLGYQPPCVFARQAA